MEEKKYIKTVKSFIVRSGRMTKLQKNAIDNYTSLYGIEFKPGEMIDMASVFGNSNPVVMEIGFGDGTATWQMAERNPETNYIAVDVYPPGVGALLNIVHEKGLKNVRVMNHDACEILETMIGDGALSGFHIFFPDPWQKKKHNKRRLINSDFVSFIVRKLRAGGYIYTVTDWAEYADQMHSVLEGEPALAKSGEAAPWRPVTKFETKGTAKGREIREFFYSLA